MPKALKNRYGVTCDIFDLNTIRPLNLDSINASVLKNRKLLCVDAGMSSFSVSRSDGRNYVSQRKFVGNRSC